jgi:hypothetical protein
MMLDPRFLTPAELDNAIFCARHDLQHQGSLGESAKQFLEAAEPLREAREVPKGRKTEIEKTTFLRISGSAQEISDAQQALKDFAKRAGLPATRALVQLILLAGREAQEAPVYDPEELIV